MSRIAGYDSHNHPLYFSIFSKALDLTGLNKPEALARIKDEKYKLATNWDNSLWGLTTKDIETDFPIIVFNASFHGMVMNTSAREKYGIGLRSSDLITDRTKIAKFIDQLLAELSKGDYKISLLQTEEKYQQFNLYGTDDMGVTTLSLSPLQAFRELQEEGKLRLQIKPFFRFMPLMEIAQKSPELLKVCAGLKIIADGALGVWTAALFEPYKDQPDNYGKLHIGPQRLKEQILQALRLEVRTIAVHCIGDRGIEMVLGIYQEFARQDINTAGWRLEHAILINPYQARLAKKLGIVLSVQPNFSSDVRYKDRLGYRVAQINNFRMLIDYAGFVPGKDLIFGSDGMPTGLEQGLKWATNPPLESQKLTMEEAKAAYQVKTVD